MNIGHILKKIQDSHHARHEIRHELQQEFLKLIGLLQGECIEAYWNSLTPNSRKQFLFSALLNDHLREDNVSAD